MDDDEQKTLASQEKTDDVSPPPPPAYDEVVTTAAPHRVGIPERGGEAKAEGKAGEREGLFAAGAVDAGEGAKKMGFFERLRAKREERREGWRAGAGMRGGMMMRGRGRGGGGGGGGCRRARAC